MTKSHYNFNKKTISITFLFIKKTKIAKQKFEILKKLLLIRHANAEDTFFKSDIERQISAVGLKEIDIVCNKFLSINFLPDLIKVSPAKRTIQTAKKITENLNWNSENISITHNLYNSDYKFLIDEVLNTSNDINNLVIIAHNPAITEVFNALNKSETGSLRTCSFCLFSIKTDYWSEIESAKIKLEGKFDI